MDRHAENPTAQESARAAWCALRAPDDDDVRDIAQRALSRAEPERADDVEAVTELALELALALANACEYAGLARHSTSDASERDAHELTLDGVPIHDARLAEFVERFGARPAAEELRKQARSRQGTFAGGRSGAVIWLLWHDPRESPSWSHLGLFLASALWEQRVSYRLNARRKEREDARRKPPAIVRHVHRDLVLASSPLLISRRPKTSPRAGGLDEEKLIAVLPVRRRELLTASRAAAESEVLSTTPALSVENIRALRASVVSEHLRALTSALGQRTTWFLLRAIHWHALQGRAPLDVLSFPGGKRGLAEQLGFARSHSMIEDLAKVLRALHSWSFVFPDGSKGGLFVMNELPEAAGRPALLTLKFADAALPHFVHRNRRRAHRLVPILEKEPPLYGRANLAHHDSQLNMSTAFLGELCERSRELVNHGGVLVTLDDLVRLADASGLPRALIVPLMKAWCHDGTQAPAFLEACERRDFVIGARYTLAPAHEKALAFLIEGGQRAQRAQRRGGRKTE